MSYHSLLHSISVTTICEPLNIAVAVLYDALLLLIMRSISDTTICQALYIAVAVAVIHTLHLVLLLVNF